MKETNGVMWDHHGPRLQMTKKCGDPAFRYVLNIRDLNRNRDFNWCFSRWTMIRIGFWFIRRAIFARQST